MRFVPFLLLLALACSKAPSASRASGSTSGTCAAESTGLEDGALPPAGEGASDATGTAAFTLDHAGPCRTLALGLAGPNGAEALRTGALEGTFLRSYGIVRVPLPRGITAVAQAESLFEDSTIAAAYVVHGADGFHLDVHVVQPAKVLLGALGTPARVGVECANGGGTVPNPAPRARNVVVLEPRGGAARYPLTVRGYARTFEANVQAWIVQGDSVIAATRTHGTAADWSLTWGEFALTIPRGPSGDVGLFVGEESAKDGTPIGVTVPLRMP